jgi:hypothetical protein
MTRDDCPSQFAGFHVEHTQSALRSSARYEKRFPVW